ncbi:MAG TPA: hypothetical protein VGE14_08130 [Marmoricola sp.]
MTTTTAPPGMTPRVLRAAALASVLVTGLLALAGAWTVGDAATYGALVGGAAVLVFFGFGAGFVGLAAQWAPQSALLVALLTYTLQVVLVGFLFVALRESGVLGDELSAGWLAAATIAGTFAWMGGQIVATLRAPIVPWERAVPSEEAGAK